MRNSEVIIYVAACSVLLIQVCHSLPTGSSSNDEDGSVASRTLSSIIRDLETAVYNLKVYADAVDSTDNVSSGKNDISLREALEFLNELAKQNKQHRRDFDIPFPFHHPPSAEKK